MSTIIVHKQQGSSLIEVMIGLFLGLLVAGAGMALFLSALSGQTDNIRLNRLNQDMRALMDIMVRDIRRAGFVTDDLQNYSNTLKTNPFFVDPTTDIKVHSTGSLTNNCIVYTYNSDNDKPPNVDDNNDVDDTDDSNDFFGFRLDGSTGNLQMRRSGQTNATCADGNWESITEPDVEITALTFTLTHSALDVTSMTTDSDNDGCFNGDDANPTTANPITASPSCKSGNYGNGLCDSGEVCNTCTRDGSPDPACLYIRNVTISLAGRLRDDTNITQTITEQVRIRNDKFLAAIP